MHLLSGFGNLCKEEEHNTARLTSQRGTPCPKSYVLPSRVYDHTENTHRYLTSSLPFNYGDEVQFKWLSFGLPVNQEPHVKTGKQLEQRDARQLTETFNTITDNESHLEKQSSKSPNG